MKQAIRASAILGIAAIIGGAFYFWTHRQRPPKSEAELRKTLPAEATQFLTCVQANQIGSCYFELTTDAYRAATDIDAMGRIARAIKEKVGDRISGALDAETFTLESTKDEPPLQYAKFTMNAIYQSDATAKERFVFVYDPKSDQFKVHTFKIHSSKF